MVRDILKYTVRALDQITIAPNSNECLDKKITFQDSLTRVLQNDNRQKKFIAYTRSNI